MDGTYAIAIFLWKKNNSISRGKSSHFFSLSLFMFQSTNVQLFFDACFWKIKGFIHCKIFFFQKKYCVRKHFFSLKSLLHLSVVFVHLFWDFGGKLNFGSEKKNFFLRLVTSHQSINELLSEANRVYVIGEFLIKSIFVSVVLAPFSFFFSVGFR